MALWVIVVLSLDMVAYSTCTGEVLADLALCVMRAFMKVRTRIRWKRALGKAITSQLRGITCESHRVYVAI